MKKLALLVFGVLPFALLLVVAQPTDSEREKGVIILAFDDGYASWMTTVAPELAAVGGVATAYVNNQRIHRGELSFEDLLLLQNKYKWEIGTHTYHHFNAPEFVEKYGFEKWLAEEVDASVKELQDQSLNVYSFVFPYNVFTSELAKAVYPRFVSFRRTDSYPIANGPQRDGSVPGSPIDIAWYSPIDLVCRWVDQANRNKQILFLYGHNVLPDSEFFIGHVARAEGPILMSSEDLSIDVGRSDLYLVPDMNRRVYQRSFRVEAVEGKSIRVVGPDLGRFTQTGASFLVGPAYGTRVSDFKRIIQYASEKLQFKTMREGLRN